MGDVLPCGKTLRQLVDETLAVTPAHEAMTKVYLTVKRYGDALRAIRELVNDPSDVADVVDLLDRVGKLAAQGLGWGVAK